MSSRYRVASSQARPTFSIDTNGFKRFQQGNHNLMVYTVLMFIIVMALYLGTKDWKGVTSPEEVDLGNMEVPQYHQRYDRERRSKHHHSHRGRHNKDYDDY